MLGTSLSGIEQGGSQWNLYPVSWLLLQGLSATMTAPTFASLTTVLTGWVFASRRTVTRMILAAGDVAEKHFSSYHRLFSAARWSLDAVGLAVFDLIEPFLGKRRDAGAGRHAGSQARPEDVRHGHAPRSAAVQSRQGDHELGTQLGRAGRDRRIAVPPRVTTTACRSCSACT